MKVLLVDDSAISRKVQLKVLQEIGVDTIIEGKNGIDALARLDELGYKVDLVMTDWNMPVMDGVTFIRELRKRPNGRRLPVIVVSSEGEREKIQTAFQAGANSYVTKPFKKEILQRKIQSVIGVAALPETAPPPPAAATPKPAAPVAGARAEPATAATATPVVPKDGAALSGDLEKLGFGELVQFLSFSRKTGELKVKPEVGEAGVYFDEGNVRDAWIGRFSSEEAFFAIARLKRGKFEFHEGAPARPSRIQQGTLALLMEAMRVIDESGPS